MSVASLGMYDFPWLAAETDALWAAWRRRLAGAPVHLDRGRTLDAIWHDPALLLAQTCGLPLLARLSETVQLVATPRYDLPGCDGPRHCSFLVVRAGEAAVDLAGLRGRRAAINAWDSNTGMNLLRAAVAPVAGGRPFFSEIVATGAHLDSLAAIRAGRADIAAIDAVTHGLAARHRPDLLDGTRILARTPSTPSLPFVTARARDPGEVDALRAGLAAVLPWPALALAGFCALDLAAYAPVADLARAAAAAGYPDLA